MEFYFVHGICEIALANCWGKPEQTHANMIDRNSIWLTHPYFTCGFEQSFSLGMKKKKKNTYHTVEDEARQLIYL